MKQLQGGRTEEKPRIPRKEPMAEPITRGSVMQLRLLFSDAKAREKKDVSVGGWTSDTVVEKVPTEKAKAKYAEAVQLARKIAEINDPNILIEFHELVTQEGDPMADKGGKEIREVFDAVGKKLVGILKGKLEDEYVRRRPTGFGL